MRRSRPAILGFLTSLIAWAVLSAPAAAQEPRRIHDPPPETEQFARLAGDWEMTVWSREQTGEWEDPHTAYWSWRVISDPETGEWRVRWTAADDRSMELAGAMERPGGTGDARQIELEIVVDGTPEEVIADWLDEATVDRFFGVASRIEPRAGGAYEIRFLPGDDDASRANATLGARVLAIEPGTHLAFEWGLPPWAEEPARSAPRTRVDIRVESAWNPATGAAVEGRTVLNLRHTGYGEDPSWDAVRRFFLWSWFNVLSRYSALKQS